MDHALAVLNSLRDARESTGAKERDAQIRSYISAVHELSNVDPVQAFTVLNPTQNSIGYLYVLELALSSDVETRLFLDQIVHFLTRFDPIQIRYVGNSFRSLLGAVASRPLFPPTVAVELLATAILRVDPTGSMFTSTHIHFAKLALESNVLEPALAVLDKEIVFYPGTSREARDTRPLCDPTLSPPAYISTTTGLTDSVKAGAVLEYNLLRSLIYSSRRDWERAFAALEQVITHPVKDRGVSKLMVECHKRWTLVALLGYGRIPSYPSYIAAQPRATYATLSAAYQELADLFCSENAAGLQAHAAQFAETWQEDGTASLVAEVLTAYQQWQIINLRKVFTEVSVGQIRSRTLSAQTGEPLNTDEEVVALIQGMLASGRLKGTLEIDGSTGSFLKFAEDSLVLSEEEFAQQVAASHARVTALHQQYKTINDSLSEKKEYVKYIVAEQKRAEKGVPDAGLGFDSQIEDEDLMAGVMVHV